MRHLNRLCVDDAKIIDDLASNKNIKDHQLIFDAKIEVKKAYRNYLRERGCPVALAAIAMADDCKKRMRSLYGSEPKALMFISKVRDELSPEVCPMCGKPSNGGTVDHFVEKDTHPEFSFFSHNLVPACGCNSKRAQCVVHGAPVRPMHPYFDKVMRRRLLRAYFAGSFDCPQVGVVVVGGLGKYRARVSAHAQAVVVRNGIVEWLGKQWERLMDDPSRSLGMDVSASTIGEVSKHLKILRDASDHNSASLNGWGSIWFSGLIANPKAIQGLILRARGVPPGLLGVM